MPHRVLSPEVTQHAARGRARAASSRNVARRFAWRAIGSAVSALALSVAATSAWGQVAAPGSATPGSMTQERLDGAAKSVDGFFLTHGDYANTRYHPAAQLDKRTIKDLKPAFAVELDLKESLQATPLVYDGVMYISTSFNQLYAVDARTGKRIWSYKRNMEPVVSLCCGANNRGVQALGDYVFMGTLDAHLMAFNAKTGEIVWDVQVADPVQGYSITMAPTVADGKVMIGVAGGEYGIRGFLKAFDAKTGKEVWTFYTTAENSAGVWAKTDATGRDLHRNIDEEKALYAKIGDPYKRLGGPIWQNPAVDRANKRVYFVVGNPSPDLDGSSRPGDNLYTGSLVSVDLETGKYVCHLQYIPRDLWDLDPVSPPILTNVKDKDGKDVPGVIHGGKTSFVYIHKADDCSLIRVSDPVVAVSNLFSLPTAEGVLIRPGPSGGISVSPMAVDPKLRLTYSVATDQAILYAHTTSAPYPDGKLWLGGSFRGVKGERQGGVITAIAYDTGKIRWQVKTQFPMTGGVLATAGGIVFATGEGSGKFAAYDSQTGEELWSHVGSAGVNAPPATYVLDGKQFVAVAAGGNTQFNYPRGNKVLVFSQ